MSRGKQLVLVAVTMGIVLTAAGTAQASIASLKLTAPLTTLSVNVSAPYIEGLPTGQTQLFDSVGNILCGPGQTVGGALPIIGAPLGSALCAIPALDYQYVTRLKTGTGEIVRRHTALVNVPTLLDVDGDILPDLVATVQVLSINQFSLHIDRLLGEASTLPLRIEAIVDDPTAGSLPRENINVGYDTRTSRAPASWRATASLPATGDPNLTTLDVVKDITGAGASITTLGGLFDGDSLARIDPMGARLRYTSVPSQSTLGLTLGRYLEARAGASVPVALNGAVEIVNGAREQRANVNIAGLPQKLSARIEEPGANQRTVTYAASATVASFDATYSDATSGSVATKALVRATGIPTGMVVKQTGARTGTFNATGGALGSVEAAYANGTPRLLNVNHPYARVFDDGTLKSFAGRIDGLQSASIDATDDIFAELQLAPDARKKLRALVQTPGRRIDGSVSNLPRHMKLTYDADAGKIDYDAFTETIDKITLDGDQATPFFGRVKKIHGVIEQLPSKAVVTIKPAGGGVKLTTDNPIGRVEALLTSGPDASLPVGELGAQVEDLASRFTAFARVEGLELVDVNTGPGDKVSGQVKLAPKPLRLRYLRDGQTIDAKLSAIPDDVSIAFDPGVGKVDYNASAGIDRIDALVTSDTPLFGRVRKIDARVDKLPANVAIGFKPASGSGATFSASPAVGMIQAALSDGTNAAPTLADGHSGVKLKDLPSEFTLFARIFNVSNASFTTAGDDLDASLTTGPLTDDSLQDLHLDATFDAPGDAVSEPAHIVGFVQDLPTTLELHQNGAETTYEASSTVPKVTLDARNLPGGSAGGSQDGDLHNAVGTLLAVPTQFKIVSNSFTTGVQSDTGSFQRVELEAWDHGPQAAALPEDGRNKVVLNTRDGRLHVQSRAFGLSKVLLTDLLGTKVETAFGTPPPPLDLAVDGGTAADPIDIDVVVTDLPTASTFELSQLLGMKLKWTAASAGTDVGLKLSSKDVGADLNIPNLPSSVDVCIGGKLDCSPQSKQIVLVDPGLFSASTHVAFFNRFTAVTSANGTISMGGKVCLPPTDDDGEDRTGDVYGTCIDGTATNRIEIDNLRLKNTRLEFASGDSDSKDSDGDPIEDSLLKLFLDSDDDGIKVDELKVRNDNADSTTTITAGANGGPPLRNSGDFYFGLFDLTFPPSVEDEPMVNQLECGDLVVEVDLPLIGATNIVGVAELVTGFCI